MDANTWNTLAIPGEYDAMDDCDKVRWGNVIEQAYNAGRASLLAAGEDGDEIVRELGRLRCDLAFNDMPRSAATVDEARARITMDAQEKAALKGALASVKAALKLANDSCRSAYQVAARKGVETNWEALQFALQKSLNEQHKVMYPEQYTEERRIRAHKEGA